MRGVGKPNTPLNPFEAFFDSIDPSRNMGVLGFEKSKARFDLAHVHTHFVDGTADVPQMLKNKVVAAATHSAIIGQKQIENK